VHWGNHTQTYPAANGEPLTIHHRGFVNATAALEWVYANFSSPESIFVTGCSAGSPGSMAFAPYVIQHYPQAKVAQLGDSLAFVFHRPVELQTDYHAHDNFPHWIPALADIRPGEFTMARYTSAIAAFYPNVTFAQYNTAHDAVQQHFYFALPGVTGTWEAAFEASLREIHAAAPNFRSYVAGGDSHCILPLDRFYTFAVNGVPFQTWVADLANGRPVESAHCAQCDRAETVKP
jgi:hypothetical protein